jgi:hypothetical protein
MDRPNVIGLRRLLTSMKGTNRAHAAILESLPVVPARTSGPQHELQLAADRNSGRERVREVRRRKEPV